MTDDSFAPFTDTTADRLVTAAQELCGGIRQHATHVADVRQIADWDEVTTAGSTLLRDLVAYADALFAHTGTSWPLSSLVGELEAADGPDDDASTTAPDTAPEPGETIWVLRQECYELLDADALIAAGRAAYRRVWPDDDDRDAASQVQDIGAAMHELEHADGSDALRDAPGLRPLGASTAYDADEPEDPAGNGP